MQPRGDTEGFTLIEILVGALIAVVILSALLLLLQSLFSVRSTQEDQTRTQGALRAIQLSMADQLRHLTTAGTNGCELVAGDGTLSFCSFMDSGTPGFPRHVAFHYAMEDDTLEQVVWPRGGAVTTNILLEAVEAFSVSSLVEGEWSEEGMPSTTPEMVNVRLELESGEVSEKSVFIPASMSVRTTLERR